MDGHGDRWGPEGPPIESYSRVTDPERFGPILDRTVDLVAWLVESYVVERSEGVDLEPELKGEELVRPTVRLVPVGVSGAPITFSFTSSPGVRCWFGHWYADAFPYCACDACDETAESEFERLARIVDDVVAGRFREEIRLPRWFGDGWRMTAHWSPTGHSRSRTHIPRAEARQALRESGGSCFDWQPWLEREPGKL